MSVANNDLSLNTVNVNGFMIDRNTYELMKETLYPGAKDSSIVMVLRYCQARKLDPVKKPVHIVPMSVKTGKKDIKGKDIYEWRDTVMPGIGLYRIDADRTGQYAGMSDPEFGEEITEQLGDAKVTYPKWCRIIVNRRLPTGEIVSYPAKEYWKENYASIKFSATPNSMWQKRPYGQLAKCAEAQALRKAFPEAVGQDYTKEEMEGKSLDSNTSSSTVMLPVAKPVEKLDLIADNASIINMDDMVLDMGQASTLDELQDIYVRHYKTCTQARDMEAMKSLIEAKDKVKAEIQRKGFVAEMDETKND